MNNLILALDLLESLLMAQVRVRTIISQAKAQGRDVTEEEINSISVETRIIEDRLLEKFNQD